MDYDMVRERRYEIDFSISGSSCTAVMRQRTYLPLDRKGQVPSTIGDLGCTVNETARNKPPTGFSIQLRDAAS
jgi:hypothetical protein